MTIDELTQRFPNASAAFLRKNADDLKPIAVESLEANKHIHEVKTRRDKGSRRPRHFQDCLICGTTFHAPKSAERKYCSYKCAYACKARCATIADKLRKDYGAATCEKCGVTFGLTRDSGKARFCSQGCARSAIGSVTIGKVRRKQVRRWTTLKCECGAAFEARPSSHRVYCSMECSAKYASVKTVATNHARGLFKNWKTYTRGKGGWVELGGQRFFARSRWEANYARYLQFQKERELITGWEHEPDTFWFKGIKRGVRSYLPDFKVTTNNGAIEYHEVKGWMDGKSRTKIKRMAKYHPAVKLIVIDAQRYRAIHKAARIIVPGWIAA